MRHGGLTFIAVLAILIVYTRFKFIQLVPQHKILSWMITLILFTVMIGWQFLYRNENFANHTLMLQFLAWTGSVLLGVWAVFSLFSIPYDLSVFLTLMGRKIFSATLLDPGRRAFFFFWIPTGILGASGIISAIGFKEAITGPTLKEVTIDIPNLPPELHGMKIAQISDLHMSPLIGRDYVSRVVEMVLSTGADMIAVTGDIADGIPEDLADTIQPLSRLKAPLGCYYVTGNHEYYWNAEEWVNAASDLGFTPLMNESKVLKFKGTEFLVGGVTDKSSVQFDPTQKSDPKRALETHKNISFKILLAHRPETCFEAEKVGWDLQLSGHTHAGQFFPFSLLMPLAHKYYRGLNRHKKMWVYVNQGTGYWGPPNRFAIPAEVTLLHLSKV